MLQKFKITSYAFIAALVLVFPSQAVGQCNTLDACEAAATDQGLQLGGNGYAFAGSYGTKGCYSYESGKYQGMAYFGTGGTETAMRATPAKPKYRIETSCEGPQSQAAGAVCHPNDRITGMYNTERHKDWEYGQELCAREGVNADVCATTWGGRCQWGSPPQLGPLDTSVAAKSQAIEDCKAAVAATFNDLRQNVVTHDIVASLKTFPISESARSAYLREQRKQPSSVANSARAAELVELRTCR